MQTPLKPSLSSSVRPFVAKIQRAFKVFILFAHQWFWIGAFFVDARASLVLPGIALGFLLVLGVELGHHRYFAHRAFTTNRLFQFILGVWATAAFQRDIFWWSSMHRQHHRYSDTPDDPHSPYAKKGWGFIYAYLYWGIAKKNAETSTKYIPDLMRFPELRFLAYWHYLVNLSLAAAAFSVGHFWLKDSSGWQTLVWLYVMPHFICQHIISAEATFAHGVPRLPASYQPFDTRDKSLNNVLLGLVSCGGGFHNNHHKFPGSARIGLRWYEIDITYLVIKALHAIGLIQQVRIPKSVREYSGMQGRVNSN